jgi:hypothetical protein
LVFCPLGVVTSVSIAWAQNVVAQTPSSGWGGYQENAFASSVPDQSTIAGASAPTSGPSPGVGSMAAGALQSSLLPAFWFDAPDRLKRTEWGVQFNGFNGMEYNVLTTQPLWQSDGNKNTLFYQVSYEHYNLYDIGRNTINGGLGYRQLLLGNQVLVGVNNFYGYELGHDTRARAWESKPSGRCLISIPTTIFG